MNIGSYCDSEIAIFVGLWFVMNIASIFPMPENAIIILFQRNIKTLF